MRENAPAARAPRAFTLVELLVVMAIISVLLALIAPAVTTISLGNSVTRAGTQLEDLLNTARQRALAHQREVDVRLYRCTDPSSTGAAMEYRAMQLFEKKEDGTTLIPASPVIFLQHTMIMMNNAQYSSLLPGDASKLPAEKTYDASKDPTLPGVTGTYYYRQFAFRAAGDTDLPDKTFSYFITIASSQSTSPKNFYTVTIDPLSAKVFSYRP